MQHWPNIYLVIASTSFVLSAAFTWILIRVAPRLGLIDEPGDEKFHRRPMPVGGGIAIYLALVPLAFFSATRGPQTGLILAASGFLALVGLIDDLRHVPAVLKFLLLIALTGVLWRFGIAATTTHVPAIDFLITAIWITGVSSAFNAIDNMDGLATGVSAIAALSFLVIALQTHQPALAGLSAALLGASLGFLRFNFSPARIFMGDTGSFFLGFFLATLGVVGEWNTNELIAAIIPILVLGLPVFDLAFTVGRRQMSGVTRTPLEALAHCDTDHLSHRLVRLGLKPRTAVLLLYLIAASFGISAITLQDARSSEGLLHLLQAVIIIAALIPILILAERGGGRAGASASGATDDRPRALRIVADRPQAPASPAIPREAVDGG